jgi:hypothetical protein
MPQNDFTQPASGPRCEFGTYRHASNHCITTRGWLCMVKYVNREDCLPGSMRNCIEPVLKALRALSILNKYVWATSRHKAVLEISAVPSGVLSLGHSDKKATHAAQVSERRSGTDWPWGNSLELCSGGAVCEFPPAHRISWPTFLVVFLITPRQLPR